MPSRHRWRTVPTLFAQDLIGPCKRQAAKICHNCRQKVCGLGDECAICSPFIHQTCQPIPLKRGRPTLPADLSKPRRANTKAFVDEAVKLFNTKSACLFCSGEIFEGDLYCRHCGREQEHDHRQEAVEADRRLQG